MKKGQELTGWMLVETVGFPSVNPQFGGLYPIYHTKKEALYARDYHNGYIKLKNRKAKPRQMKLRFVKIIIQ